MKTTRRARFHAVVRLPLLPFAAVFELLLWVSAFLWAQVSTKSAADIITLAESLPDIGWYFNRQSNADLTGKQKPEKEVDMSDNAKPASDCTGPSCCSAVPSCLLCRYGREHYTHLSGCVKCVCLGDLPRKLIDKQVLRMGAWVTPCAAAQVCPHYDPQNAVNHQQEEVT